MHTYTIDSLYQESMHTHTISISIAIVTKEEVKILWNRFRMLNPDESGCISREVFRHPPYSANIFCKQVCVYVCVCVCVCVFVCMFVCVCV